MSSSRATITYALDGEIRRSPHGLFWPPAHFNKIFFNDTCPQQTHDILFADSRVFLSHHLLPRTLIIGPRYHWQSVSSLSESVHMKKILLSILDRLKIGCDFCVQIKSIPSIYIFNIFFCILKSKFQRNNRYLTLCYRFI